MLMQTTLEMNTTRLGGNIMRFKLLGILAAVALVSACSSATEDTAATTSTGSTAATPAPAAAAPASTPSIMSGSQEDLVVNVGDRVYFGYDQFNLSKAARTVLDGQAAWMKANSSVNVTIEGHCDERGTREYNLALGERRANASKDYLVALGVNPNRIRTLSYGKERPVALGSNDAAWSQNRRGVTVVNSSGS